MHDGVPGYPNLLREQNLVEPTDVDLLTRLTSGDQNDQTKSEAFAG